MVHYEELIVNIQNSGSQLIELKERRKTLEQAFVDAVAREVHLQ
jgi:hypothetical protein